MTTKGCLVFTPRAMLSALGLVGALLFTLCVQVQAQQAAKVYRIGYLANAAGIRKGAEEIFRQAGYWQLSFW